MQSKWPDKVEKCLPNWWQEKAGIHNRPSPTEYSLGSFLLSYFLGGGVGGGFLKDVLSIFLCLFSAHLVVYKITESGNDK